MHRWHLGPDPCLGLARLPIHTCRGVATHLLGLGRLGGGPCWLGLGRGGSSLLLAWFDGSLGTSSLGGGGTLGGLLALGRGDRCLARLLLGWGLLGDEASGHGASALRASFYHGAQQQVIDYMGAGVYTEPTRPLPSPRPSGETDAWPCRGSNGCRAAAVPRGGRGASRERPAPAVARVQSSPRPERHRASASPAQN